MGCITGRCFTLTLCVFQLVSTSARQVCDFLGYMWAPIIANFLCIICAILGFFGIYQYRPKYIIVYCIWCLLWIGWNVFIVCFYLEVGSLSRNSGVLNINTGSRSWWEVNGVGCKPLYNNSSGVSSDVILNPSSVHGCLVEYQYIESIQAALQVVLAILVIIGSSYVLYKIVHEDDSLKLPRSGSVLPPYSIEYQHQPPPPSETNDGPMTPRKVKRRSTSRNSTRSSTRSNRKYRNPVTKMMERSFETSSNDSYYLPGNLYRRDPGGGISNLAFDHNSRSNSYVMNLNGHAGPLYRNESETVI